MFLQVPRKQNVLLYCARLTDKSDVSADVSEIDRRPGGTLKISNGVSDALALRKKVKNKSKVGGGEVVYLEDQPREQNVV
jgi:hypothetical protein